MQILNNIKKEAILFTVITILLLIICQHNIVAVLNNCLESYDYGLYWQAALKIAKNFELNPLVTIRGLNIFNDHFMPVIYLTAPFIWLTGFHHMGLVLFELTVLFLSLILIFKKTKHLGMKEALLASILLLLTKGVLTGLIFPVHPGVWSIPIWLLLTHQLYAKNDRNVILLASSLFLFRESFPFCLIGLAIYFILNKSIKKSAILFLISIIQIILIYKIRPILIGPTYDYGGHFLSNLITAPIEYITKSFYNLDIKAPLKLFYPFIIPLVFIIKNEIKNKKEILTHPLTAITLTLGPLILLHFLANKFHYQYGTPITVPFLGLIIFSPSLKKMISNKRIIIFTFLFFLTSASSTYTKFFKLGFLLNTNKCKISSKRRAASNDLKEKIKLIPQEKWLFSTKRIVPTIMNEKLNVSVPYYVFSTYKEIYDYLLIEKNFNGDIDSVYSEEKFQKILHACQKQVRSTILNNNHFYFAKGKFDKFCYSQMYWENR